MEDVFTWQGPIVYVSCLDSLCGEVFVVIFEGFDFERKSLTVRHMKVRRYTYRSCQGPHGTAR